MTPEITIQLTQSSPRFFFPDFRLLAPPLRISVSIPNIQAARPQRILPAPSSLEILQIALKASSSEFTVVQFAGSKLISESSGSRLNSDYSDEKEITLKQNLDVLVPKYIGTITYLISLLLPLEVGWLHL